MSKKVTDYSIFCGVREGRFTFNLRLEVSERDIEAMKKGLKIMEKILEGLGKSE